jgi:Site-specific recombinases, DNA invertase Pin homologs
MTKYGYARVSTLDQKLENQIHQLEDAGAEKIYQEKFTGTTTQRPQFNELLNILLPGDMLIITKLDRFARNTREALDIIQQLFKQNIKVQILNVGTVDNTPTGNLIFTIFSAFAQFERDMIVTRTQEGKLYAKTHDLNFREGRPKTYTNEQIKLAYELRQQGLTYKMIERKTGISVRTQQRRFKNI